MAETRHIIWLVCPRCRIKEAVQQHTPIVGCPTCGEARSAQTEHGQPVIFWSSHNDVTDWSAPPASPQE